MAHQNVAEGNALTTAQPQPQGARPPGQGTNSLVVISILNWNGWRHTLECLESVRKLDYPNYLTVVVDNGSWDGSVDKIRTWMEKNLGRGHVLADYSRKTALIGGDPEKEEALDLATSSDRMVLIRNEENLGFTGGNNVAIHYALTRRTGAEYVFLLNNDAGVLRDCLSQLVTAAHSTGAGLIGAIFKRPPDGRPLGPWLDRTAFADPGQVPTSTQVENVNWLSGGALLAQRALLHAVWKAHGNYLDDRLFVYGEDAALSSAAARLGYSLVRCPSAIGWHRSSSSTGGGWGPLQFYYNSRNTLYAADFLPPLEGLLFRCTYPLKGVGRVIKYLVTGRPPLARACLWGMVDAYRHVTGKWREHDAYACVRRPEETSSRTST